MNIKHFKPHLLSVGLILLTLVITYTLLTLLSVPSSPKLKSGSGDSLFVASNTIYSSAIGTKSGDPQVTFSIGSSQASFIMAGIDKVTPKKESSTSVLFPSVQPDTDLRYTTTPNGLKEELILHSAPSSEPCEGECSELLRSNVFLFDLSLTGVTPKKLTNDFIDPSFKDERGNYLFHFDKPFAVDANGNRTNNVLLQIGQEKLPPSSEPCEGECSELYAPKYFMKLIVDQAWLSDPARVYPITIDPTILHDTTAEFVAGTLNRLKDTGPGATATLESYYQELPTDQYTVGLWHLNEASGNALDSSGNANTGTPTGTTVVSGLLNNARSFDGSSYISIPDLKLTSGTVEMWINPNSVSGDIRIFAQLTGSTGQGGSISINQASGETGSIWVWSGGAWLRLSPNNSLIVNTWYHLAFIYSGGGVSLYINGILVGSATSNFDFNGVQMGIGANYILTYGSKFGGIIDEVRISNIARTPEEIKSSASRRPYSVYTSDVLDLTNVTSWNPLQWSEHGVNTGDGETLKSSTNLVAQWNFNETSGTTANNDAEGTSCGGTPANCDATLAAGFASTTSQDQTAGTGWTAANKRWGTGSLMFDGSNDYASVPDRDALDRTSTSPLTISAWVFPTTFSVQQNIFCKGDGNVIYNYCLYLGATTGNIILGGGSYSNSLTSPILNQWNHIIVTFDGSNIVFYLNGKLVKTNSGTIEVANAYPLYIGYNNYSNQYFKGIIDSASIYSRALGAAEIMSNYQAGNIEFQTRVGADTSPDDGDWEAWKPTTGETAIDAYDSNPAPDYYSTLLLHGDGTDASTAFPDTALFPKTFTVAGNAQIDTAQSKFGGSSMLFDGTGDYIDTPDHNDFTVGSSDFTVDFWLKLAATGTNYNLAGVVDSTKTSAGSAFRLLVTGDSIYSIIYGGSTEYQSNGLSLADTNWHHVALIRSGNNLYVALDGTLSTPLSVTGVTVNNVTAKMAVGRAGEYATSSLNGWIDEFRISKGIARWTTTFTPPTSAYDSLTQIESSTDTNIKIEGTGSEKLINGRAKLDGSTVGLWHLDETGGTGAYIKDSTSNANHGTPTGTTVTNGISGKARSFAGTGNYITTPASTSNLAAGGTKTVSAWIKTSTPRGVIFNTYDGNGYQIWVNATTGNFMLWSNGGGTLDSGVSVTDGKWHHVTGVWDGTTGYLYVDGILRNSAARTISNNSSGQAQIGVQCTGTCPTGIDWYFTGLIDEVIVANIARSAEEIAESYRAGRDHYINKTISSTDLSAKTSLPFYVAADRPGSYLSATIGESAFANYQPDANTVGLWHLAEQSGSGAYIKDSSGNGNHGTPIGTTFTQGKIGKARAFSGSTQYVEVPDSNSLDLTTAGTIEVWAYKTVNSYYQMYVTKYPAFQLLDYGSSGQIAFRWGSDADNIYTDEVIPLNQWTHIAATYDGSNLKIFINGRLSKQVAYTTNATNNTETVRIGARMNGYYFYGSLDEVRISNIARTADEIRQAYEVGLRTHPITIDFGAKLDSGNLITGSGDLGFTVDATYYGLQNKGDMLFKGDKVIVRENYDGTEYIAQGTVDAITASTGATTVSAWDSGSTFPSGGYTVNASVFKWQREYWNINNETLDSHTNAITNLSLRLTDGAEGRTIWLDDLRSTGGYLTDPAGSTVTSSTGSRYMQYRSILSSFDEAVSATLSAVTVDYVINTTPATPSLDVPTDTASNQILSTVLKTTSTDPDSDYLRYKIELCDDVGMTTNCQTFDQTSSQTGWSGQNAQTSTAYTSGTQATYTLQTPLTVASTYYWRSYAIDPAGVNTWSGTQTPYSFTTTTAPTAPTVPYAEGSANPTGIIDLTPEFSAIHNDPNGDSANYYEIEVNTDNTFTGTVMWDSNQTAMTSTADGVRSPDLSYAGTSLSYNGATYYWRIRFTDVGGAVGAWSATQSFSTNIKPGVPSLDTPTNTAINQSLSPALKTTATDADSDYVRYKIELCTDLAMTLNCQTFDQTVSQTGWTGQNTQTSTAYTSGTQGTYTLTTNLVLSTTYYWRSYAIDPGGSDTWSTTQTPYSFVTRQLNEGFQCLLHETADDSSLTIVWQDNEAQEDSYKLERNVDSGGFSAFQTLAADSVTYQDTSITTGHTYQYRVAPYINATSSYGDWCTTSTLSFQSGLFNFSGLNFSGLNFN